MQNKIKMIYKMALASEYAGLLCYSKNDIARNVIFLASEVIGNHNIEAYLLARDTENFISKFMILQHGK